MSEIMERTEDGMKAELINLEQVKASNRVDDCFLAIVLEAVRFEPKFCKWMNLFCTGAPLLSHK